MKTDSIFYELFLNIPESLFNLLKLPPELAKEYQFISQELKQLAKRIDGVFLPNNEDKPIYFVEVQFQSDENLYYRLFTEIFTYLGQYKPCQDFYAVVLWEKRNYETPLPSYYQVFQDTGKLTVIYLDELSFEEYEGLGIEILQLIVANEENAKNQVNTLFNSIENSQESSTKKKDIIELLEKILIYKFTNYTREELDKMFTLTDFKKTRFYQDTYKEGKIEGKIEGKLESIFNLMKLGLSIEQIAEALELDLELLKKVAKFYDDSYTQGENQGKIKSIPNLMKLGLSIEQIAEALELDLELVRKVALND
ncbi:Rpn family recombination-promoting nuclease/putative transposase [Geminocystis sp. CENA526]|uniref:Rpn family recombination-promoting nuclease/putative transposase n=1 Tax=Geminocystis sp. CENA526 TaxID=1355871 RepID=UPI003D6F23F8